MLYTIWDFLFDESVLSKYKNKLFLLYGCNDITKSALIWMANKGYRVEGFVMDSVDDDECRTRFLDKPFYSMSDIPYTDNYILVDAVGNCKETLNHEQTCQLLRNPKGPVIVYGTGKDGMMVFELLKNLRIEVFAFCAQLENRDTFCGIPLISFETLISTYSKTILILTQMTDSHDEIDRLCKVMQNQIYVYRYNIFRSIPLYGMREGGYSTIVLNYLLKHKSKKLILYGNTSGEVTDVAKILSCFDLNISYGIVENEIQEKDSIEIRSAWDLFYESPESYYVIVLSNAIHAAKRFISISGIDADRFFTFDDIARINRDVVLDSNLGYTFEYYGKKGIEVLCKCDNPQKKVCILGGSTSDTTCFIETPWPKYLLELAEADGLNILIYAGGTAGYIVSQECIKLIRDIVPLHPDIVISYSGVNDACESTNLFVHSYQQDLFNAFATYLKKNDTIVSEPHSSGPFFGENISYSASEHWLIQERLMASICREMDIKFFGILQPSLMSQRPMSLPSRSVLNQYTCEHWLEKRTSAMNCFHEHVKNYLDKYSWLRDFTSAFDGHDEYIYVDHVHLTSLGNKILADTIYNLIKPDLIS